MWGVNLLRLYYIFWRRTIELFAELPLSIITQEWTWTMENSAQQGFELSPSGFVVKLFTFWPQNRTSIHYLNNRDTLSLIRTTRHVVALGWRCRQWWSYPAAAAVAAHLYNNDRSIRVISERTCFSNSTSPVIFMSCLKALREMAR